MDLFYVIVVSVAVVLLIVILTYIGIQMKTTSASATGEFPPIKQTCPDKWSATTVGEDKTVVCVIPPFVENSMKNVGNLYNTNGIVDQKIIDATPGYTPSSSLSGKHKIDFNHNGWSTFGMVSDCKKKEWANTYNIVWDGISNYNMC
jgi:uncharacterized protein (UPF0333 family)